jgi:hypothetical protein
VSYRAFVAVVAEGIRLIDNMSLNWVYLRHDDRSAQI